MWQYSLLRHTFPGRGPGRYILAMPRSRPDANGSDLSRQSDVQDSPTESPLPLLIALDGWVFDSRLRETKATGIRFQIAVPAQAIWRVSSNAVDNGWGVRHSRKKSQFKILKK